MTSQRDMAGASRRSVLMIAAVLISLAIATAAHSRRQIEAPVSAPLKLRIIISDPDVCIKQKLNLEIELQNVSEKQVLIDPKGVFYQLSFSSKTGAMGSTHDSGYSDEAVQYVSLQPGESYRKQIPYSVNAPFFSAPGLYRVQISYGQFNDPSTTSQGLYRGVAVSNVVLFEIADCSN